MSVGSATVAHPLFQAEGGGSNPAPHAPYSFGEQGNNAGNRRLDDWQALLEALAGNGNACLSLRLQRSTMRSLRLLFAPT